MERAAFESVSFGAVAALVAENLATATDARGFHPGAEELRRRAADVPGDDKAVWVEDGRVVAWAVVEPTFSNLLFGALPAVADVHRDVLAFGRRRLRAGGAAVVRTPVVDGEDWRADLLRAEGFAPVDRVTHHEAGLDDLRVTWAGGAGRDIRVEPLGERVEEYVDVHRQGFATTYLTPERKREWRARPDHRGDLDLCAVDAAGALLGAATTYVDGGAAYLAIVVVHPDHQGRGLARALVTASVDRLRAQGARTVASTTGAPALRHLLEDIGLATVATTHWWQGPLRPS